MHWQSWSSKFECERGGSGSRIKQPKTLSFFFFYVDLSLSTTAERPLPLHPLKNVRNIFFKSGSLQMKEKSAGIMRKHSITLTNRMLCEMKFFTKVMSFSVLIKNNIYVHNCYFILFLSLYFSSVWQWWWMMVVVMCVCVCVCAVSYTHLTLPTRRTV